MKKFMTILAILTMIFMMTACENAIVNKTTIPSTKVSETILPDGSKTEKINRGDGYYYINEYNPDGNQIKSSCYTNEGILDFYSTAEYDSNGNSIKVSTHNADGTLKFYHTSEYDSDGNKIKDSEYNADGTLQVIFEYDSEGNHIKTSEYNADGTLIE